MLQLLPELRNNYKNAHLNEIVCTQQINLQNPRVAIFLTYTQPTEIK